MIKRGYRQFPSLDGNPEQDYDGNHKMEEQEEEEGEDDVILDCDNGGVKAEDNKEVVER